MNLKVNNVNFQGKKIPLRQELPRYTGIPNFTPSYCSKPEPNFLQKFCKLIKALYTANFK